MRHIEIGQMTAGSVDVSYTWPNFLSNVGSVINVNSIDRLGRSWKKNKKK